MSPFIMFCAPGTGKSQLVNKYPELFIDCDTIIEELMGESVNTLCEKPELWAYAKNQIIPIWKRVYPTKILLTGKTRFIHQSAIVVLHDSAETMAKKCSSADRNNPIYGWDFDAKHQSYLDAIVDYKGLVHVLVNSYSFLSGAIFKIIDNALKLYFIDSCEAVYEIMQIAEANRQKETFIK